MFKNWLRKAIKIKAKLTTIVLHRKLFFMITRA